MTACKLEVPKYKRYFYEVFHPFMSTTKQKNEQISTNYQRLFVISFFELLTIEVQEVNIMANNNSRNSNQLVVPGAQQALDQMKIEIAQEFGVNLGADTTSRANGSVGGEITKRLVQTAQQQLGGQFPQQ